MPVRTDPAATAAAMAEEDWHSLSAGEGTKGPRLHRARAPLARDAEAGLERWLPIRRRRHDPEALALCFAQAPQGTSPAALAGAAGPRRSSEQALRRAKDDLGLDRCEARSRHGWQRHITPVLAAPAPLATPSADRRRSTFGKEDTTSPEAQAA